VSEQDLSELRAQLCDLALRVAQEHFAVSLDFSTESIERVEQILGAFHEHYVESRDDDGLHGIALEFACYIIAVIERHFEPGTLRRDHSEFGPDTFPYEWAGAEIFPYSWCLKRIFDGPQDDVAAKFQVLVVQKASEGAA